MLISSPFPHQSVVSSQDEEKERLNTELKTAREQLAAMTGQAGVDTRSSEATRSAKARPDSYISVTSSASEVGDSADDAAHVATSASDDPSKFYCWFFLKLKVTFWWSFSIG